MNFRGKILKFLGLNLQFLWEAEKLVVSTLKSHREPPTIEQCFGVSPEKLVFSYTFNPRVVRNYRVLNIFISQEELNVDSENVTNR